MEMDIKLDQDFLFYLDFVNLYLQKLKDPDFQKKAEEWITKLCAERCIGIDRKRNRNIYLAQLLLQMQDGKLKGEFLKNPLDVDINHAMEVFQPISKDIQESWLEDVQLKKPKKPEFRKKGNTVIATRTLKNGQGAFAYIGLSLSDEEPKWISVDGAGDLAPMQKVLSQRKTPHERQNCVNFFDVLSQSIVNELEDESAEPNEVVDNCLENLIMDLKAKNEYGKYEEMSSPRRRKELLHLLQEKVVKTAEQVKRRTLALDNLVQKIYPTAPVTFSKSKSFFETSPDVIDLDSSGMSKCPASSPKKMAEPLIATLPNLPDMKAVSIQMWQLAASKLPSKKNLSLLLEEYSSEIIDRFLGLLVYYKGMILEREEKKIEYVCKELQADFLMTMEKYKEQLADIEKENSRVNSVVAIVKERYETYIELIKKANMPGAENAEDPELTELKEMIKLLEAYIQDEHYRGQELVQELNEVHEQINKFKSIARSIMQKAKRANCGIEKNIANLSERIEKGKKKLSMMDTTRGNATI